MMDHNYNDSYKLKGLRKRLVEEISAKGAFDPRILKAFEEIPRHFFIESAFAEQVYEDKAFPIGEGQTISQPYTVAYQTHLLEIKPGDKVLEIGTGSGYQAAILAKLGAKVFSIERHEKLSQEAKDTLRVLHLSVKLQVGDGTLGWPRHAPYDKIIVTAAAPVVPETLLEQLNPGGLLVIPVGDRDQQQMLRIKKLSDGTTLQETYDTFRFVPLIGKAGW